MPVSQLSNEQINRYKRHLILPEVGMEGQKKLLNARVLCIGAGGLGCPISLYLAAAGVGTIGLADVDVVSPSNLQRQVLFGTSDVGEDKVKAAAKKLKDLNPDVKVIEHKTIVNSENVLDLIKDYDIVIDGTDNFPTRYCVGDACVIARKPNVYGSIFRFEGQVTVFAPHPAWNHRHDAGQRGDQAHSRCRQAGDRQADVLQCDGFRVPRIQTSARPELPGVRRPSDDHEADRLRAVLRSACAGSEVIGRNRARGAECEKSR
jgi:molybdopterin/thiamine biosynthesis adenylyltransferase